MDTSFVTLVAKYFKSEKNSPLFMDLTRFTDRFLLEKLKGFGINLDKSSLRKLAENAVGAEDISCEMIEKLPWHLRQSDEIDWIVAGVSELWKRWFPDLVNFEILRDKVDRIYSLAEHDNVSAAARVWYRSWNQFVRYFDRCGIKNAAEYRQRFSKYIDVFFWIENTVWDLSQLGGDHHFLKEKIDLCEELLNRLSPENERDELTDYIREILAKSYFTNGDLKCADELFRIWLTDDPSWTRGWLAWSYCFSGEWGGEPDFDRADPVLQTGISYIRQEESLKDCAQAQHDLEHMLEERIRILNHQNRTLEACALETQLRNLPPPAKKPKINTDWLEKDTLDKFAFRAFCSTTAMSFPQPPVVTQKDSCPCGSGSKFKHCCGSSKRTSGGA